MMQVIINGLSYALPLLIIGIGGIYSERSGVTNLALEGLLGFGAFTGGLFVAFTGGFLVAGSGVQFYASFAAAALGGALFALLHALLCIKLRANQVISGVVINIAAMALTGFLTVQINDMAFGQASNKFSLFTAPRYSVPFLKDIPVLGGFFTDVYPFEPLILVLTVVFWFILYRTRFGLHLRACGDNPQAVDAAGVNVARVRLLAVMISGLLSGIGGMCFAYSISTNVSPAIYFGAGYLAIAAMIFGNWKIVPTLGACLIFGFARSAAQQLVLFLKVDSSVTDLAMAVPYLLVLILLVFFSKSNRPPKALGTIYDKGER
ncbi:MAG: ABC transporter permease [Coriobacteriales bacterium]|jgi:simple sugar transport system permease protein|nr:ABC transporter permease [Coriobacteriales bacterium]